MASDPTPKEIAQRAARIRAQWDEATRMQRKVGVRLGRAATPVKLAQQRRNAA